MRSQTTNDDSSSGREATVRRGLAGLLAALAPLDWAASSPAEQLPRDPDGPYQLAGRLLGHAVLAADEAGDERFPDAFAHSALASGIEASVPEPERLEFVVFLAGALYDLTNGVHAAELTAAAGIFLETAEVTALIRARASDADSTDRLAELHTRIHSRAAALAMAIERDLLQRP